MPSGPGEVLHLIRHGRVRTRGDIQRVTGLSRMTVAQRVDALIGADLIRGAGAGQPSGGRRPTTLEFNVDHSVVVAASVDTTDTRTALTDLSGRLLDDERIDVGVVEGPEKVLHTIGDTIRSLLQRSGISAGNVSGAGICVPGPVDPLTSRPSQPPIMPGWDDYPVAEKLRAILPAPAPVLVENDANAMAIGEQSTGYSECRAVCLVKVSTGIGSGIVIDGRIYQGIDGGAGDIGHVRLADFPDALCQCGSYGCLAAVASGRAVAKELTTLGIEAASEREVRHLLALGDIDAMRLTQQAGHQIGKVMATVICVLNPETLLIGGALASTPLISGIRETLYPRSLPRATQHLEVRRAGLGDDAGIVGMNRAVVDEVFAPSAVDAQLA